MFTFSEKSKSKLYTCHPKLIKIMEEAIKMYDFSVLQGVRGEEEQNKYYELGYSKLKYPNSRHNSEPSTAVDIAPYPIDWENIDRFKDLAQVVKKVAFDLIIPITWGGDWKWKDYPHYQLDLK